MSKQTLIELVDFPGGNLANILLEWDDRILEISLPSPKIALTTEGLDKLLDGLHEARRTMKERE
jgi:hypothetical protein